MKKNKLLKITGIVLLFILAILITIPFFLESRISGILKSNVNNNINGTFDFEEANLSLIRNFPNASLSIRGMYILNKAPFEGDTLVKADAVSLTMGIGELFKGAGEPIGIRSLTIDKAKLNILVDEQENANYDIARETGPAEGAASSQEGFTLDLQAYELNESEVSYYDRSTDIKFLLEDIHHRGTGDLSLEKSEFETMTTALISLEMDSINYLERNSVKLDALIGIDLSESEYSFLRNEALLNNLPLVFEGFVQLHEDYQDIDIQFRTPSSDFKNFLAVIPETYSKNIEGVTTTGNFVVEGGFNGRVDDTHIPKFNIDISSENASFKYPDLPKSVRNIHIDAHVKNTTGLAEDTFIELNKVSFMIDSDQFNLNAVVRELMGNTRVVANLNGNLNLANLSAAYPVPADLNLKGQLKADINTAFDMASVENKQYGNTRTKGYFNLSNFEYDSPELANPVAISSMTMEFNPSIVTLKDLKGVTGSTDFTASGTINNLLGYLFNKELVEGNFKLNSNNFVLNDFMVEEDSQQADGKAEDTASGDESGKSEQLKIPSFLDCTIEAAANTVQYDNLTLRNVSGTLRIKDETAVLSNLTSTIFDGKLAVNGTVSTKDERPTFTMQLGMDGFRISETFKELELFQVLAPVANALEGRLNSQVDISGLLGKDFTPDLASISGNALASLLGTEVNADKAPILNALSSKLNFLNASDFDLRSIKTALSFENGVVNVKPFTVKYKDIAISVNGGHGFDRSLNYTATLEVPAAYLGSEVNDLLARINDQQLQNLTIPVTANIGGNYTNPTITTDFTSGVKTLTTQLVEIQKQKLIDQGKDKARDLIGGLLSGSNQEGDTLSTKDSTKTGVKEVIGGILNQKGQTADTTATGADSSAVTKEPVKETARQILGGLLGKKKKDSVN